MGIMKGMGMGVFSYGCDMKGFTMNEFPEFLVSDEYRHDEGIDKSTYFKVDLCIQQSVQQTEFEDIDSLMCDPCEFKTICKKNSLSFSTVDGAKEATRWIIACLQNNYIPSL